MKKVLILLFFTINLSLSGATYYVSPSGNDGAAGTLSAPWKTWHYAFNRLVAGDILYVRGGTYSPSGISSGGPYVGARMMSRKGTATNPIQILAYQNEVPVLDCSNITQAAWKVGLYQTDCNYVHFKGLTIQNINEHGYRSQPADGWVGDNCSNITVEQCVVRRCAGGFRYGNKSDYIYFINCDAYNNGDLLFGQVSSGGSGGYCNGFGNNINSGMHIYYDGCRAWENSDDGWDAMAGSGYIYYNNCWAFENGHTTGDWTNVVGDGVGFKLGSVELPKENGIQRVLTNCLAWENDLGGFEENNNTPVDMACYNCTAWHNKRDGFGFYDTGNPGVATLKNCIAYNNDWSNGNRQNVYLRTNCVVDHCTFLVNGSNNSAYNLTTSDFASLVSSGAKGARQADGSLPELPFLHLVTGSDLIDAGVNVGLPFSGKAPDLGAYEIQGSSTPALPVYTSSVVENATPSLLEMTYNITLANVIPGASAFSVRVNSAARTVNAVTVSASKVLLTLASSVVYGDVVTVSYTKPSVNPLQTPAGGMAANIINQPVVNNLRNIAPKVVITSPADKMSFTAPANITITADASDPNGSVTIVEFYNGNTKLGSKSKAPYSFDWNNVVTGTYTLTVVATDNQNVKTTSSAIAITVTGKPDIVNQPPVVMISNPSKGTQYDYPATIDIEVVATDPDGIISKVVLFNDSTKLVELTSAPFLYSWKDMKVGNYSIKAVAYDNLNANATSSLIDFKVAGSTIYDADSEIINLYPNPNNGNFSIEIIKPLKDENCKIVITNLGGKQISNIPILKAETLMHFDMSYIKSGIYIIMVIGKGILVTKKFIKQ